MPAKKESKARTRIAKARITKLGSTMARESTGKKASRKEAFDTEAFLTTMGAGRTITAYKAKSYIFQQGTVNGFQCQAT